MNGRLPKVVKVVVIKAKRWFVLPGAGIVCTYVAPEGHNFGRIIKYYDFCAVGTKYFLSSIVP
jgi:hypothetical protein